MSIRTSGSIIFFILGFLFLFFKPGSANAILCSSSATNDTLGIYSNYNSGTIWEVATKYCKSGPGTISSCPQDGVTSPWNTIPYVYILTNSGSNPNKGYYSIDNYIPKSTDRVKWQTACVDPVLAVVADRQCTVDGNYWEYDVNVSCKSYPYTDSIYGGCGYDGTGTSGQYALGARNLGTIRYNRACPICNNQNNWCSCVYAGVIRTSGCNIGCNGTCTYTRCSTTSNSCLSTSYSSSCGTGNSCAPPPPAVTATASCVSNAARISTTWSTVSYSNGVDDFRYKRSTDTTWIYDYDAVEPKVLNGLADNTTYNIGVRGHTESGRAGPTDWGSDTVTTGNCNGPDLNITSLIVPDGNLGTSGNASITVQNSGAQSTNAGFNVGFHRNGSSATCSTSFTGTTTTTTLAAGASRTVSVPFTYPSTLGAYTAVAMADSSCQITETNETNNTRTDTYSVTGCSVSGNVYVDANNNGAKDTGEVNYSGATLSLSGPTSGTTTTNNSGNYSFAGLNNPNPYTVTLTPPSGYTAPTTSQNATVCPNAVRNFPLVPVSTLTVHVCNDFNGNGVEDGVDTDSVGRTVTITGRGAGTYTTNAAGNVVINNLIAGTSNISVAIPSGWTSTTTNPRNNIILPPSQIVNFCIRPTPPTCTSLTANPTSVGAGGNSTLTCNNPSSPTGDPLTFNWFPDSAIENFNDIVNPTSSTTNTSTWTAPSPWWTQVVATPSVQVCNPGGVCSGYQTAITVVPRFTISGNVFVDDNKDGLRNATESNYTSGTSTINIRTNSCGGPLIQSISSVNGVFTTGQNLAGGTYYVCYTSQPLSYQMTEPINVPPPSFSVTVGNASTGGACSAGGSKSGACDANGYITNLNFGITNSIPWIQTISGDVYYPSGSQIPDNNPTCGPYMSLRGSGNTPGIINCGGATCNFGAGQASQNPYNWQINDAYVPKGDLKTSYGSMLATAQRSGITPTPLGNSQCGVGGIGNCVLAALSNGVYIANGNLTLTGASYTLGANRDIVILVNGDLNINTEFHVPVGSTALFTASGNINVAATVGEVVTTSVRSNVEGYFSTDRNFNVLGLSACPTSDRRLNVAGAVVVNAAFTGGELIYARDLCANNLQCPIFMVLERPDFILNAPDFFKSTRRIWQEIAP